MSKDHEEIVINDVNRPFQFDDSDLRLVSSDDVVFKIHTWKLKAASSVFQVMFEAGNKDGNLQLTDENLENSKIISMFLKIVYGLRLQEPLSGIELMEDHENVLQLIVKYDASAAKEYLCICFRLWAAREKFESYRYFLLASQLNDYEMAATSLKHAMATSKVWIGPPEGSGSHQTLRKHGLKGGHPSNIAAWPFNDFRQLSHEFIFGFLKAREIVMEPYTPKVDYKLVAAEFEKIMKDLTLEKAN